MSVMTRRSSAGGKFELQLDGRNTAAYIRSVEGGWGRAEIGANRGGPWQLKQISTRVVDPLTMELGVMTPGVLRWIQRSWNASDSQTSNGQLSYADLDIQAQFVHEFYGALLTKVTFPTLDGASKDGGYLTCELQPERVATNMFGRSEPANGRAAPPDQKRWAPSAFRFNIDGLGDMRYVNRIDSFTASLQFKRMSAGGLGWSELVPLSLSFPNLSGSISLRHAQSLIQWHNDYIHDHNGVGRRNSPPRRNGSIEFLSADRSRTLFQIKLTDVGPLKLSLARSNGDDVVKRLRFELFVRKMSIEGSPELGFA